MDRLLRLAEVRAVVGLSRSRIYVFDAKRRVSQSRQAGRSGGRLAGIQSSGMD